MGKNGTLVDLGEKAKGGLDETVAVRKRYKKASLGVIRVHRFDRLKRCKAPNPKEKKKADVPFPQEREKHLTLPP